MKTERDKFRACAEYADRLVDLSDGDLAADQRPLVESHISACARCREELARLNASLAVLRGTGFQPVRHSTQSVPAAYYAAALSLVLLLAAGFVALRIFGPDDAPKTAGVMPRPNQVRPATDPPVAVDEAAVLRRIALIEQQARLQASLDLMPKDPWFAEQRAANEELLAQFKEAVAAGGVSANSREGAPATKLNLDEGDPL
ncbi:MAG TPA: hypothetical protein VFB96_26040 [Pirellulaceae bacterium]|nr:hypothetical protein [Pirellulaceae bacterium]